MGDNVVWQIYTKAGEAAIADQEDKKEKGGEYSNICSQSTGLIA